MLTRLTSQLPLFGLKSHTRHTMESHSLLLLTTLCILATDLVVSDDYQSEKNDTEKVPQRKRILKFDD